jgi:hypothetical protein
MVRWVTGKARSSAAANQRAVLVAALRKEFLIFGMGLKPMTTKDEGAVDISKARKRRAEILQPYSDPFDGFVDQFEAEWRAVWTETCKRNGKTISFEEWFYATDENGVCPFEIAGVGIRHDKKGAIER